MTEKERKARREKFATDGPTILTLCKMDALDLGMPKTARAIDRACKEIGLELAALRRERMKKA